MRKRSPFPGMDPWLERSWGDIHHELIANLRRQVAAQLPGDLFAAVEENVYVVGREDEEQLQRQMIRPDAGLLAQQLGHTGESATAVMEPETDFVRITFPREPIVEGVIEIRRLSDGNPLVTVIEVLSPTNKPTSVGKRAYLKKRHACFEAKVHLVEIDLLREGDPLLEAPLDVLILDKPRLATPYRCSIRRGDALEPTVDILPISLRQRLPRIPIPLRSGDPVVIIDLQEPIDSAYQLGSYARRTDYSKPPAPPLSPQDAEWAAALVSQSA